MAITDIGYDGTISDVEFAQMQQHSGVMVPVVCGKADLAVAINGAATLTCTVAPGSAAAPGVFTTSDATESVVFDVVSTGGQTRWDAVVLRRNWSTGVSTIVIVKGTAAVSAPMVLPSGVDSVLDAGLDQVLALVQITNGQSLPTAVVDRRVWGSKKFTIPSSSALPTPTAALYGMEVETPIGERYRCLSDSGGNPAWLGGAKYASQASSTAALVCSTSAVDIPGLTLTVPVVASTDTFLVTASLDLQAITSNGGGFTGRLLVNGTTRPTALVWTSYPLNGVRNMPAQTWLVTGLAAGNRVFKCNGVGSVSGSYRVNVTHSTLTVVQL